jgi:hypothetical protein
MTGDDMLITDKGMKPRSCNHCKHKYAGKQYIYGLTSVEHKDMDGFICAAFAEEEGLLIHMTGLVNDTVDFCEMFKERGER